MPEEETYTQALARQRRAALEKAWARKRQRSALRKRLKAGELDAWALIRGEVAEYEEDIKTYTLQQLLQIIPHIGPARVHEVLATFKASPMLRVRALSDERRVELARIARSAVEYVLADYEQRG